MREFLFRLMWGALLALCGVLAALVVGAALPSPQIAYEARKSRDNYDIHLLDVRWRVDVPLTRTPYGERHPSWSPDGETLAYSSDETGSWEIYLQPMAGGEGPIQLTAFDARAMNPAWSPDGTEIAFDSSQDGNLELYVMTATAGAEPRRLTTAIGVDERPVWSPDGESLAFASYRDSDLDIYLLDVASGETRNLTDNLMFNEWGPSFSPDGETLVFASTRGRTWQLYLADMRDNAPAEQMTALMRDTAGGVWSPEGDRLVVEIYDQVGTRSLYLLPAGARGVSLRGVQRLTAGPTDDRYAAWRPR